jgi:SAM-dependent methyltransferase
MRNFRLPERVDLVLCEYDALNHVPRKSDLARVARAVARALKPGGHFFFDVNNRLGFQSYWKGTWCVEKPGLFLAVNNGNDAANDTAWINCEWFIRQGHLWRRHHETVREVCWSLTEMRHTLKMAGFDRVRAWDSSPFFKDAPHITHGCRTHYLAKKHPSSQAVSNSSREREARIPDDRFPAGNRLPGKRFTPG